MLFSLEWLLQLCPADREVDTITAALTDRGLTVDSVEPSGRDHLLDIDVPANRPDCLGHLGVARELAAAFEVRLAPPTQASATAAAPAAEIVRVEIADPSLCPRYTAGVVRDVRIGPSPEWVVRRLEVCGLRSVNSVVDVSNLVMLELGQPVHFFDLDRLASGTDGRRCIRIRNAAPGELLRTLDGVERPLRTDSLLITDADRPVALAGVIGGADTEIVPSTQHVLVEAAHFDRRSIRATARRLGIQTDASYRFERGLDPEAPAAAQALAARLLHELAGGEVAPGIVDAYPGRASPRELLLHPTELQRLLGFEPTARSIRDSLAALHLAPTDADGGAVRVIVPSWRGDLEREADLVEEVARHLGYDRIPVATAPTAEIATDPSDPGRIEDRSRDLLAHCGFHEAIGYAMIGVGEDDRFVPDGHPSAVGLVNPIAEPLARLRRSILPGLLRAADLNLRRGSRDVRLFEVGRVFRRGADGTAPLEPLHLGLAWSGNGEPHHWSRPERPVDLHDITGIAEHLRDALRPGQAWTPQGDAPDAFHPARSVRWTSSAGATIAWGGALHPSLQRELDQDVYLLELALDELATLPYVTPCQRPVARVPSVSRDLSLVLARDVSYRAIVDALRSVGAPAPVHFEALDRYEGPPLGEGETALTVRVTLVPLDHTLSVGETEAYRAALVTCLQETLGVRLRS